MKKKFKYFLLAFFINFSVNFVLADSSVDAEIINGSVTGDGSILINVSGSNYTEPDVDLMVTKTINSEYDYLTIFQGDALKVEVTVKNIGSDTAHDIEIKDFLDNSRISDIYGFSGICEDLDSYVYCIRDSLVPGESTKISYIMEIGYNARIGLMETYARASSDEKDTFSDDNIDSVRVMIQSSSYIIPNPLYAVHLSVKHDARERNQNGNWKSADTLATASEISNSDTQEIQYRIIIGNDGNTAGHDIKIKNYFSSENMSRMAIKNIVNATWDSASSTFIIPKIEAKSSVEISFIAVLQASDFGALSARSTSVIYDVRPTTLNLFDSSLVAITGIGATDYAYVKSVGTTTTRSNSNYISDAGGFDENYISTSSTTNSNSNNQDRFADTGNYAMPISSTVSRSNVARISGTVAHNSDYVTTYYAPTRNSNLMRTGPSELLVLFISLLATSVIYSFRKFKYIKFN